MTRLREIRQQHKYYKKKVEEIEEDRKVDRSSELWRIIREHKKIKLKYKTELLNAR